MNRQYNEERALHSLRSVYYLQSALADYLYSFRTLLEARFNMVEDQNIIDNVYRVMKNVNELQKFINQKIEIFSETYTESELYALYLEYKPRNEEQLPIYIRELYDLTRKCFCTNWKRTLLSEEINQFFLLFNRHKKLMNEFRSYRNDISNTWLSDEIDYKQPIDENKEVFYIKPMNENDETDFLDNENFDVFGEE